MDLDIDLDAAKQQIRAEVEQAGGRLDEIAAQIHARPELLYEERFAAALLAGELEAAGFRVERGAYGVDTAFAATARPGGDASGPHVAILCEYDALPGIGHGCGHNLIAAAGLGAALAAARVATAANGRLTVLGTPAEEGGGGKIRLIEAGAFEQVDVAMMVHPAGVDLSEADVIAIATWQVDYHGHSAHAAAYPERGRNALDAAVLGYNAVAALRQHIGPRERIHGVFKKAGDKPNIVPDHTVAEWYVRSPVMAGLVALQARVRACLQAGTDAAGCTMEITPTCPPYTELRTNPALIGLYKANSAALGRPVPDPTAGERVTVSTDMGNVSLTVPSIHPLVAAAPAGTALHTADFAAAANGTTEARRAVRDGAAAMAMTAADIWLRPEVLAEIRAGFTPGP